MLYVRVDYESDYEQIDGRMRALDHKAQVARCLWNASIHSNFRLAITSGL